MKNQEVVAIPARDRSLLHRLPPAIRLLRPHQWTKGLLVFAAPLFANSVGDAHRMELALRAFVSISLVSSGVYVWNDLIDVERDRRHPVKCSRPIASGQVSETAARILMLACLLGGLLMAAALPESAFWIVVIYLGVQFAYNCWLKRQPVADVFCLASGFVLRAALGAAAIAAVMSGWLLFCTGGLALLLGFGKRRHEFMLQGDERGKSRESLESYTKESLDAMILTAAGCAAMSYGIYAIESSTAHAHPGLIVTAPIVLFGIYRYLWLIFGKNEGGEPDMMLIKDGPLIATLLVFLVAAGFAMSGMTLPIIDFGGR